MFVLFNVNIEKYVKIKEFSMKRIVCMYLVCIFLFTLIPSTYAASIQIKIDGVVISADVMPEVKNDRTMVPLRVISEKLGASVNWSNSEIMLHKNDMKIILHLNSNEAEINGELVHLDAKPYLKDNRVYVPIRFIAETFDCKVNFNDNTVMINTEPLYINNIKVKTLKYETSMTLETLTKQIEENTFITAIYNSLIKNKGNNVDAPEDYSWKGNIDVIGSYAFSGTYEFQDIDGKSIDQFELYYLLRTVPGATYEGYSKYLLLDTKLNKWYIFSEKGPDEIKILFDGAEAEYT